LAELARWVRTDGSFFATSASRLSKLRRAKKKASPNNNICYRYLRRVDNRPKARSQQLELLEIGRRRRYVRCWDREEIKEKVVVLRELDRAIIYNE
jgi:hypothetical protein